MLEGASRASAAAATATSPLPHPDSAAALPPPGLLPPWGPGTSAPRSSIRVREAPVQRRRAREEPVQRRSADVAPKVTCGICGLLLRDATAISECLHAFCRDCIYHKVEKEGAKCCPICGAHLGSAPKEKLRPDRSLQNIRSVIFPAKRRKKTEVSTAKNKRKEKVSAESTLSSVVDMVTQGSTAPLPPAALQIEARNMVVGEADEALVPRESVYESSILNLAPVGRDVLSQIRCRDLCSPCHLSAETGALTLWQQQPILEEMAAHDQLAPRQDPDTKHQQQVPTVQMTNTSVVAGTSFHARMADLEEILMGDVNAMFNEIKERVMGRYHAYTSQLKADNSKLIKELEIERAAALDKTRILEERHKRERKAAAERTSVLEGIQRELENELEAAAKRIGNLEERLEAADERTKILEERLQISLSFESRCQSLEAENAKLYGELENGRAANKVLVSENLKKKDELMELKHYSDTLVSDKIDLENKLKHVTKEYENAKKEKEKSVDQLKAQARAVMRELGIEDGPH